MNVQFFRWPERLASGRLRGSIPQAELAKLGVGRGREIVIASKHGWDESAVEGAGQVIFDVCDDHFGGPHEAHYRQWCKRADAVTCNTQGMARIIFEQTGREALVVNDPFEQPECAPRLHDSLLWYGHATNLAELRRVRPEIEGHSLHVVTNSDEGGVTPWSIEAMDAAFARAGLVIIPTGPKQAKSGNRAVEAIRRGLFVVAEPMPSYAELGIWIGPIGMGVKWALSHRAEVKDRIKASQAYVRSEFSPRKVAFQWLSVFETI